MLRHKKTMQQGGQHLHTASEKKNGATGGQHLHTVANKRTAQRGVNTSTLCRKKEERLSGEVNTSPLLAVSKWLR
jgi:hypothetical protein